MATYIWVSIGSGNGLLPDGTKPLPESMLTHHKWCHVAFTRRQYSLEKRRYRLNDVLKYYTFKIIWKWGNYLMKQITFCRSHSPHSRLSNQIMNAKLPDQSVNPLNMPLQWRHNERGGVCSGADQRKHQSSASLAFVSGIHRWPVVPLTKGQ